MCLLVSILNEAGFFALAGNLRGAPGRLPSGGAVHHLILLAAVLAMWMDSITVMLFLSALRCSYARFLNLNPVPLIIAEVSLRTPAAPRWSARPAQCDPRHHPGLTSSTSSPTPGRSGHRGPAFAGNFLPEQSQKAARCTYRDHPAKIEEINRESTRNPDAHLTRCGVTGFLIAVGLLVFHIPLSELTLPSMLPLPR